MHAIKSFLLCIFNREFKFHASWQPWQASNVSMSCLEVSSSDCGFIFDANVLKVLWSGVLCARSLCNSSLASHFSKTQAHFLISYDASGSHKSTKKFLPRVHFCPTQINSTSCSRNVRIETCFEYQRHWKTNLVKIIFVNFYCCSPRHSEVEHEFIARLCLDAIWTSSSSDESERNFLQLSSLNLHRYRVKHLRFYEKDSPNKHFPLNFLFMLTIIESAWIINSNLPGICENLNFRSEKEISFLSRREEKFLVTQ